MGLSCAYAGVEATRRSARGVGDTSSLRRDSHQADSETDNNTLRQDKLVVASAERGHHETERVYASADEDYASGSIRVEQAADEGPLHRSQCLSGIR